MRPYGQIPRSGIGGKSDPLRVECSPCGHSGRYSVARLMRERGCAWKHEFPVELAANCSHQDVDIYSCCRAMMPDLPRIV